MNNARSTVDDIEKKNLDIHRLKKAQGRALSLCRKAGIPADEQRLNAMSITELRKVIGSSLDIIENKLDIELEYISLTEKVGEMIRLQQKAALSRRASQRIAANREAAHA